MLWLLPDTGWLVDSKQTMDSSFSCVALVLRSLINELACTTSTPYSTFGDHYLACSARRDPGQ